MIPLEKQVSSLELSQKLKELGVKQESLFQHNLLEKEYVYRITYGNPKTNTFGRKFIDTVSAFTVAELGEILPKGYFSSKQGDNWVCNPSLNKSFGIVMNNRERIQFFADTEADARAKMLVYLLENKLITL